MKVKHIALLMLSVMLLVSCSKDDEPVAVEDEGIYINEVYASAGEDWIELYNSADVDKDISGYKIYDETSAKYALPQGTTIAAKDFLVLVCDDTGVGLNPAFKLSSAGEKLTLENRIGSVIDRLTFPALNEGESYGRYPDGSDDLKISGNTTRGAANGEESAPIINFVNQQPLVVLSGNEVLVSADISLSTGTTLNTVKLLYSTNSGAFTEVVMNYSGGTTYYTTIPAIAEGVIRYYVKAETINGVSSVNPFGAPEDLYEYTVSNATLPQLFINEVMALNTNCCPDTDGGVQEFDDWIEIYNAGTDAIDVGGMYLSDDPTNPFKNKIPTSNAALTTIQPGGFLLLWADENGSQGEKHLNFQLSGTGETVGIYFIDGRAINERTFGGQVENQTSGLLQDGGSSWGVLASPSPGSSNN
jgi:hypothetical protein